MSRNKQNQEISFLREKSQRSLQEIGFIRDISKHTEIKIVEPGKSDLKIVTIDQLSDFQTIEGIWEINLEYNDENYPGLAMQQGSTPEKAILILQKRINQDGDISNYHLSIILVELKESLQPRKGTKKDIKPSTLQKVYRKFKCAMNRMYMLLSINNHSTRKPYQDKSIYVTFQGIIFYNRNEIKDCDIPLENDIRNRYDCHESNLYDILTNRARSRTLVIKTIVEPNDKIEVQFIQNPKPERDQMTIPLKNLLDR